MIGDLFIARKVSPDVLENMTYSKVLYWHSWHKLADNAEIEENKRLEALRNEK